MYYALDPMQAAGGVPRAVPLVVIYVEGTPEENVVERSWLDYCSERIADRFGAAVELGWLVEDTRLHWGVVRGTKPGEADRLVKILERLRAEWAAFPNKLTWED